MAYTIHIHVTVCIAYHVRVPVASSEAVEADLCSMGPLLCGGWDSLLDYLDLLNHPWLWCVCVCVCVCVCGVWCVLECKSKKIGWVTVCPPYS